MSGKEKLKLALISLFMFAALFCFASLLNEENSEKNTEALQSEETPEDEAPIVISKVLYEPLSSGFGAELPDVVKAEPEETAETTAAAVEAPDVGEVPYPTEIDDADGEIRQTTYTFQNGDSFLELNGGGQVRNCTSVTKQLLAAQSEMLPEFRIELNAGPQVLIMHTHTTETYEPYERTYYDADFTMHTTDATKNMVMVGTEVAAILNASGISTIHDTTVHDYPSYNGSYGRSAETVEAILAENPSIKIVLDLHRDSIMSGTTRLAPVAEIGGKKAAQIMIISGCDDGTMGMPNYLHNFRLAALFQQQLESDYEGFTRPILFDYRKYNQHLTTGSLLIEVGSAANSLEQARYSGELLGRSISRALLGIAGA